MTNQELIVESKYQSAKTTENLKKSLKELEEAKELGENSLITIKIDNEKLDKVNQNLEEIQTEAQISVKILTRFSKKIFTDKLIILFSFLVLCTIVLVILIKKNII